MAGALIMALLLFGWAISWKLSGEKIPLSQAVYFAWAVSTACGFLAGLISGIVIIRRK